MNLVYRLLSGCILTGITFSGLLQTPVYIKAQEPIIDQLKVKDQKLLVSKNESLKKISRPRSLRLRFSPDGKVLASANEDGTISLWNVNDQQCKIVKAHKALVSDLVFSHDGKFLVSASWDGTVKFWNLQGKALKTLDFQNNNNSLSEYEALLGNEHSINSISLSLDDQLLALYTRDGNSGLRSIDGKLLQQFSGKGFPGGLILFSPDGKTLAIDNNITTIELRNLDGKIIKTLVGHQAAISEFAFSSDGKTIVSAGFDGTVRIWTLEGQELQTLKWTEADPDHAWVIAVSISPDGKMVAAPMGMVRLWNSQGQELRRFPIESPPAMTTKVMFSPDNQSIVIGDELGRINLWNLDGSKIKAFDSSQCTH